METTSTVLSSSHVAGNTAVARPESKKQLARLARRWAFDEGTECALRFDPCSVPPTSALFHRRCDCDASRRGASDWFHRRSLRQPTGTHSALCATHLSPLVFARIRVSLIARGW
jgi:hypothetical protein